MQSLFAEFIKLNLTTEIRSNNILHFLAHGRFKVVLINLIKILYLVEVNLTGTGKEAWNVLLEDSEGCVEIFKYTDDRVLCLDNVLCSFKCTFRVKWSVMRNVLLGGG